MIREIFFPKGIALIAITLLMLGPAGLMQSYASSTSNEVVWQLLYIKQNDCNTPDMMRAQIYADLTSKYLELYELENKSYEINCILTSEYESFEKAYDTDLMILIFDEEAGQEMLLSSDLDGLYAYSGNDRTTNHTVILCDCSEGKINFESALSPWILSHELSHFVLSYKGFSLSAITNIVHDKEDYYNEYCLVTSATVTKNCDDVRMKIRTENTPRDFVVIAPYSPAVGNTLLKYIYEDIDTQAVDMQRSLTTMWLTGEIDDNAYVETLKNIVDTPVETFEHVVPFLDIPNGFVIAEVSKNIETDWNELLNPDSSEQERMEALIDYITVQLDGVAPDSFNELPNWFKARALMWSEQKISDKVFFDGIEHLVRMGSIQIS